MNYELLRALPVGASSFAALRADKQVYVDKTMLIYQLATRRGKYFLARPRHFGKSLLISTFESLFKFSLRDFNGIQIENYWKEKGDFKVVRLDFSRVKPIGNFEDFREYFDEYIEAQFEQIGFVKN